MLPQVHNLASAFAFTSDALAIVAMVPVRTILVLSWSRAFPPSWGVSSTTMERACPDLELPSQGALRSLGPKRDYALVFAEWMGSAGPVPKSH